MARPLALAALLAILSITPNVGAETTQPPAADTHPNVAAAGTVPAARDFAFEDMKGAAHTLAEFRGHPVLLEFWASWCVPCRKGFPFLENLGKKHAAEGLIVIAVTLETDDEAVKAFVSSFPASFLVGRDRTGRSGELFQVAAMPTALLLDPQGTPLARFEGGSEESHRRLEESVAQYLAGRPLTAAPAAGRKGPAGSLKAWERAYLADPIMNLDGDTLTRSMREHIHASKEAAAGDGGVAGGGCGCN